MKRKIALIVLTGVVLVVMMFAMSPGVAVGAKGGGVVAKGPPDGKGGGVVAKGPPEAKQK